MTHATLNKLTALQLQRHPNNPRKTYRADDVERMAESIRGRIEAGESPFIQPPIVVPYRDDLYYIVAGHLRHAGMMAVDPGYAFDVIVREAMTDEEIVGAMGTENGVRVDLSPGEWSAYIEAREKAGVPMFEIIRQTGLTRNKIDILKSYAALDVGTRTLVDEGKLPLSAAPAILRITSPKRRASLTRTAVAKRSTVDQIEAVVRAILSPRASQAGSNIKLAAGTLGNLRTTAAQTCRDCAQYSEAEMAEPAWHVANVATGRVCKACGMHDMPGLCNNCPLALMLTQVIKTLPQEVPA